MLKINPERVRGIADDLDKQATQAMNIAHFFAEELAADMPEVVKSGDRPECMRPTYDSSTVAVNVCSVYNDALSAIAESILNGANAVEQRDRQDADGIKKAMNKAKT